MPTKGCVRRSPEEIAAIRERNTKRLALVVREKNIRLALSARMWAGSG
jgi:hypothetical protein